MAAVQGPDHAEVAPIECEECPSLVTLGQHDQGGIRDSDFLVAVSRYHLGAHLQISRIERRDLVRPACQLTKHCHFRIDPQARRHQIVEFSHHER